MFVVLEVARLGQAQSEAAWHQVTPFFIVPFILLAPVNGAISNSLPRRWVLVGSAGFCLGVTALAAALVGPNSHVGLWLAAVGLNALGAAVYSPTRYALLPAVAEDTGLALGRVVGWIETGGAAAIVSGMVLGWYLHGLDSPAAAATLLSGAGAAALLNGIGLLTALPASFPSDTRRPELPTAAVAGFFQDTSRIVQDREARAALLGLAAFIGLLTAGTGAMIAYTLSPQFADQRAALPEAMVLVAIGAALGSLLAGLQAHPRRQLGLVPYAAAGLLAAFAWAAVSSELRWPAFLMGVMGGILNVPLRADYQAAVPADARGNGMAVMNTANYLCGTLMAVLLFAFARLQLLSISGQLWLLAAFAGFGILVAWWVLFRDSLEQLIEILIWPFYRIRAFGPDLKQIPLRGPLLVVANHTAWFDPAWLAKVLPRRLTPMMTSRYYDLPLVSWLMVHVVRAIRVQVGKLLRDPPEIQEAIEALDRGECLVIFPEGYMRRRSDRVLSRFGQGIWRILSQRPATPVVVCWIEGGWGSYASYAGGPPAVNKPMDWWRAISIGVAPPQVLDPGLLADHRATRTYLMRACLEARRHLGLPPLTLTEEVAVTDEQE
jgi:1-acyl-sn-glycerol-3-phosphate acyltransferase